MILGGLFQSMRTLLMTALAQHLRAHILGRIHILAHPAGRCTAHKKSSTTACTAPFTKSIFTKPKIGLEPVILNLWSMLRPRFQTPDKHTTTVQRAEIISADTYPLQRESAIKRMVPKCDDKWDGRRTQSTAREVTGPYHTISSRLSAKTHLKSTYWQINY